MSKASEWAKAMQEHRLARPSCIVTVQDARGGQEAGLKEIAFVVAYDGVGRIQLRGGVLLPADALVLADWIREMVTERQVRQP